MTEITKTEIHAVLIMVVDPELADLWWDLRLPAWGGLTADEMLANGRGREVMRRVETYSDPLSFG